DALELDAEVFADELAAGEDGDVFAHGFAAITEARRFDGADVEGAAELVHDESRERFAFDVLSDDQQRFADLGDLLENREQVFETADLLLVVEDVRIFEPAFDCL